MKTKIIVAAMLLMALAVAAPVDADDNGVCVNPLPNKLMVCADLDNFQGCVHRASYPRHCTPKVF
jgi:hypothetical protein